MVTQHEQAPTQEHRDEHRYLRQELRDLGQAFGCLLIGVVAVAFVVVLWLMSLTFGWIG